VNVIDRYSVRRSAALDAKHNVNSSEDHITAAIGQRSQFDPAKNPEHGETARVLAERPQLEEDRQDMARKENEVLQTPSPLVLASGLVVAVAIELVGAFLIVKDIGISETERVPVALALALAVIGLTTLTARGPSPSPANEEGGGVVEKTLTTVRRAVVRLGILITYTAVAVAIAVVRIVSAMDDQTLTAQAFAGAVVMLAASIGPAWFAESLIRRWRQAGPLRKQAKILRKRLRKGEKARARAQATVNRITKDGTRWDGEAAKRRAEYAIRHRLESARRES
jgi:hypothetical protein